MPSRVNSTIELPKDFSNEKILRCHLTSSKTKGQENRIFCIYQTTIKVTTNKRLYQTIANYKLNTDTGLISNIYTSKLTNEQLWQIASIVVDEEHFDNQSIMGFYEIKHILGLIAHQNNNTPIADAIAVYMAKNKPNLGLNIGLDLDEAKQYLKESIHNKPQKK